MFNSKGNNFGAGVIPFKDVQEDGYAVLNARFTCSPQCAEYKAAEVLEIYVPALSIERSADAGVVVRFRDRRQSAYGDYAYDSGTETRLSESEGFLTWPADERVNGFGAFVLMTGLQYPCVLMLSHKKYRTFARRGLMQDFYR